MTNKEIETCRKELMEDFKHLVITIDDILTEILIRLPPESIAKFRQVSKRWRDLITSPSFLRSYRLHKEASFATTSSLLGLFHKSFDPFDPTVSYLPTMDTTNYDLPRHLSYELRYLRSVSNGFLLFDDRSRKYRIVNPITKLCVSLPSPKHYSRNSVGLLCEPRDDLVLRYIVVLADLPRLKSKKLCIESYSSETREWRKSTLVATSDFPIGYSKVNGPTVVGGLFFWLASQSSTFAVYDPKESGRQNHLQLIERPIIGGLYSDYSYSLSESLNGILRYGSSSYEGIVDIWELPKGEEGYIRSSIIPKEEWVLKYTLTLPALCIEHPIMKIHLEEIKTYRYGQPYPHHFFISYLHKSLLVDFIPGNHLVVLLRLGRRVYSYNFESKVLEVIELQGGWLRKDIYPYFESRFLSPFLIHSSQRVGS